MVLLATFITATGSAQNPGVGTVSPVFRLHIEGRLLVNAPAFKTNTAPTEGGNHRKPAKEGNGFVNLYEHRNE